MDITPSRTAVIAVHMQHDIVAADGAFGGFFALLWGGASLWSGVLLRKHQPLGRALPRLRARLFHAI